MPNNRKYISTEYGLINLRDGDWVIHLDPEALAELYWEVQDEKLVRVVRCKDCTWFDRDDDTGTECPVIESGGYPKWDGYCAWGKKKDE